MISLLGLLQHSKILCEHLLLGERDTIDALHLIFAGIAPPESTSHAHQLDSLDDACGGQMGTLAKVGKVTLCIGGYGTVLQILLDMLHLIDLTCRLELCYALCLGHLLAHQGFVLTCQLYHLILDVLEISLAYLLAIGKQHIIEESILDGRTEAELDTGIQLLQSFCQQVGTGMPEGMLTLLVLKFIEVDSSILIDRAIEFHRLSIHTASHHILGQTMRNTLCYLQTCHPRFILPNRTVGKSYLNHRCHELYISFFTDAFLLPIVFLYLCNGNAKLLLFNERDIDKEKFLPIGDYFF